MCSIYLISSVEIILLFTIELLSQTNIFFKFFYQDGFCKFKADNVGATDTGFVDIPHENEDKLQEAVATIGPISVAIDAGHRSFQLYKEGVYNEPACSSTRLDHGVLAVGYGSDSGKDYWLVKNRYDVI